ncbi:MAG: hypothetical protein ACXABY_07160 [Candidatus Thorarchaeota archaeon]|jgi:hypothetical protein
MTIRRTIRPYTPPPEPFEYAPFDSDYLKDAYSIATEEKEIVPITLKNGEEGCRVNPEFYEEDW